MKYSKTNLAKSLLKVAPTTRWPAWVLSYLLWVKDDDVTDHTGLFSLLWSPGGAVCSIVCTVDDDVSQCASSAVNGFKAWSDLTCHQRGKVLLKYNKLSFAHIKTFGTDWFCNWPNGEMTVCVTLPLPTGWWAYLDSTDSVCQSCLSCVGPPAHHLSWSGCCSTTAAGPSSETHLFPTGHHWVSLWALVTKGTWFYCNLKYFKCDILFVCPVFQVWWQ